MMRIAKVLEVALVWHAIWARAELIHPLNSFLLLIIELTSRWKLGRSIGSLVPATQPG
jgi:p-aminobenzoyl-glutamate transporter AbgT